MRSSTVAAVLLALLELGCAARQRLTVRTVPAGAEVTLAKYGTRRLSGGFAGLGYGSVQGDSFADPPILLGASPVTYEFPIEEDEAGFYVAGVSGSSTRIVREVAIRATRGTQAAERRVRVTGNPIEIELQLQDAPEAPPSSSPKPPQPGPGLL